jgi:hypothetical protein
MAERSTPRSRARTPSVYGMVFALAAAGCRFGGKGENPFADTWVADSGIASGGASGIDPNSGGGGSDPGAGGASSVESSGGFTTAIGDASSGVSAGGAAVLAYDASTGIGPGACQPPLQVAFCDPVKNTGCIIPFSFCDIDPTQAVPGGRCVFPPSTSTGGATGTTCEVTSTTETCWPMSSCVNGTCRKLCYCDSDCSAGECCRDPAPGPSGVFKMCKPC